ncbi:MAG: hypothetical protein HYR63_14600 [Proteobacteria bacterium]|nr:hypothetical protein [Pseudomonadota bacterium]MBI3499544.1 hypothetical protein [Pseudomonadota bacterium]
MVVRVVELIPLPAVVLARVAARRVGGEGVTTLYEINAAGLDLLLASPELQSVEVVATPGSSAAMISALPADPVPLRRLTIDLGFGEPTAAPAYAPNVALRASTAIPGATMRAAPVVSDLTAAEPGVIAFQIEDDQGAVLQAGSAPDPRYVRGELSDADGRLFRRLDGWVGAGELLLDVPDLPGAAVLRLRIVDRADGGPIRARDRILRLP